MTAFAANQNMASVCASVRIIPILDAAVLVVSICAVVLRVIILHTAQPGLQQCMEKRLRNTQPFFYSMRKGE